MLRQCVGLAGFCLYGNLYSNPILFLKTFVAWVKRSVTHGTRGLLKFMQDRYIRSRLIKIGNSQGFRVPKPLLDQCGIVGDVEIHIQTNQLVIRPIHHARQGWDTHFVAMADAGDDVLLDGDTLLPTAWESQGWQW
ncbi:AbrB/MazE/SpoVT family DNA-binding domain-containing protein [Leptolyngbya sp. PCC 6406]|uniref:AbrB/MazE/SpoVT family DNA-binding domain-containing protein n=1 Tax=Leptolyngbya sp. PCC 6406 TaxID=1173264 RepID=UPI0021F0E080|nr:AbrB/MazE/SpoVT family DNA-binding domain-containing protein [Leptolyngbya sp. PCC 6406]